MVNDVTKTRHKTVLRMRYGIHEGSYLGVGTVVAFFIGI